MGRPRPPCRTARRQSVGRGSGPRPSGRRRAHRRHGVVIRRDQASGAGPGGLADEPEGAGEAPSGSRVLPETHLRWPILELRMLGSFGVGDALIFQRAFSSARLCFGVHFLTRRQFWTPTDTFPTAQRRPLPYGLMRRSPARHSSTSANLAGHRPHDPASKGAQRGVDQGWPPIGPRSVSSTRR